MAFGRESASEHAGFFPHDTDIITDDEITVTKGTYLTGQFKVQFAGHHGAKWDVESDLSESTTKLS